MLFVTVRIVALCLEGWIEKAIIHIVLADETFRSRKRNESNPTNAPTRYAGQFSARAVLSKGMSPVLVSQGKQAFPLTMLPVLKALKPPVLLKATANDSLLLTEVLRSMPGAGVSLAWASYWVPEAQCNARGSDDREATARSDMHVGSGRRRRRPSRW